MKQDPEKWRKYGGERVLESGHSMVGTQTAVGSAAGSNRAQDGVGVGMVLSFLKEQGRGAGPRGEQEPGTG